MVMTISVLSAVHFGT